MGQEANIKKKPNFEYWKPSDYNNEELLGFLEMNDELCAGELSYLCSEILKRLIKSQIKIEEQK